MQLDGQEQDVVFQAEQRVKNAQFALAEAQRRVAETTQTARSVTELHAPVAGRISEISTHPGTQVSRGQPVVAIETAGEGIEMLLFLPHRDGDKLAAGMSARISPSWTTRAEDGALIATVSDVSKFPLTPEAIRAIIHNDELVRTFSSGGAPILARLALTRDAATASGYAWTSSRGADIPVESGGSATADVQIKSQRPIELVLPALRRLLGT